MKQQGKILIAIIIVLFSIILTVITISFNVKTKVKELFNMNKTLQEEGYYMADFEFQMVGFGYYLGKGQFYKSIKLLNQYHKKLSTGKDLIKIPEFKNNQEEINFYLNLQNPKTGAFIDDSAPYCTYWEVSQNIINHMEALVDSTTTPLKLKYPLRFLDKINSPGKLITFLEDVSYVGWPGYKFPQTSFHFARNILGEAMAGSTLERTGFYKFSPEWEHTMLKWMYDFQDTTTGMWGPKNKNDELTKLDLNNTASILKSYRDNDGNDLHEEFPLKYQDKLFKSAIEQLSEPLPDDDDLDEIHEWNLRQSKGINMLLRHLWKDASSENKKKTIRIIEKNIDICFKKYYVREEGAFSYYPNAGHASPDGISNLIFSNIGAFSNEKQKKLWGDPSENARDLGVVVLHDLKTSDLDPVVNISGINSIRIYTGDFDFKHLTDGVWAVFYPKDTPVLDIMELVPNIVQWTETSSLSIGNWSSMEEITTNYSKLNISKPQIFKGKLPYDKENLKFKTSSDLYIVGFDKLQIPRCKIKFSYTKTITKSE